MVGLAVVVVACFAAGVWATTRWLPPLTEGTVGLVGYFLVAGLAAAALTVAGIHIWEIVRNLELRDTLRDTGSFGDADVVAAGLRSLLWESGILAALASLVYLVGPKAESRSGVG